MPKVSGCFIAAVSVSVGVTVGVLLAIVRHEVYIWWDTAPIELQLVLKFSYFSTMRVRSRFCICEDTATSAEALANVTSEEAN